MTTLPCPLPEDPCSQLLHSQHKIKRAEEHAPVLSLTGKTRNPIQVNVFAPTSDMPASLKDRDLLGELHEWRRGRPVAKSNAHLVPPPQHPDLIPRMQIFRAPSPIKGSFHSPDSDSDSDVQPLVIQLRVTPANTMRRVQRPATISASVGPASVTKPG